MPRTITIIRRATGDVVRQIHDVDHITFRTRHDGSITFDVMCTDTVHSMSFTNDIIIRFD